MADTYIPPPTADLRRPCHACRCSNFEQSRTSPQGLCTCAHTIEQHVFLGHMKPAPAREASAAPGAPVTNSGDVSFVRSGNGGGAISNGDVSICAPATPDFASDVPPSTIQNPDVQFSRMGVPIWNDLRAGTVYAQQRARDDADDIVSPFEPPAAPRIPTPASGLISNESGVSFIPQVPEAFRRPSGDVFLAPSAAPSSPDSQILPTVGGSFTADTDRTFGGGGDTTRRPRQDEFSFSGQGNLSVGSADIRTAPSGDHTRAPGEDVHFALSEAHIGNQEIREGAKGGDAPVANKDHFHAAFGAVGNPLKRNVT